MEFQKKWELGLVPTSPTKVSSVQQNSSKSGADGQGHSEEREENKKALLVTVLVIVSAPDLIGFASSEAHGLHMYISISAYVFMNQYHHHCQHMGHPLYEAAFHQQKYL